MEVGALAAENNYGGGGHAIKDPTGENDEIKEIVIFSGEHQHRSPKAEHPDGDAGGAVDRVDIADGAEEISFAGSGIRDPGAGQDGSVEGGENADQGGNGDRIGARAGEDFANHFGRNAVRAGDFPGAQHVEISPIREQIDRNYRGSSADQGEGQISLRVADFRGNHADVVPAVVGPEGGDEGGDEPGKSQ